ncbi:hypothetical protein [Bradyrhizobium japonicum]|uniref:hypothetical protein n=1 Tax=Bradyrhizobium japonicum TaxID=375 RepID=UPI001364CDD9|nr:hypothetical protein [Bradyrhizobium japonicum]
MADAAFAPKPANHGWFGGWLLETSQREDLFVADVGHALAGPEQRGKADILPQGRDLRV